MSYNQILVDFSGSPYRGSTQTSTIIDTSRFLTIPKADPLYINSEGDSMGGNLNMNNNKIINLENPINAKDAANKEYVDSIKKDYLKYLEYGYILQFYKPVFWISTFYDEVKMSKNNKKGIKYSQLTNFLSDNLFIDFKSNDYIVSEYEFKTEYTFIAIVKPITGGRIFTSLTGNKLFGFWDKYTNTVWHDKHIHGILESTRTETIFHTKHLISYACSGVNRQLYIDKKLVFNTSSGPNTNFGNLVIGDTIFNEGAEFELYECLAFDKRLDTYEIDRISNIIF